VIALQASFSDKYSSKTQSAVFVAIRIGLVLFIALVAAGVPGFGLFISLIGSLACASLSFIVPALCHLILFRTDMNWYALLAPQVNCMLATWLPVQAVHRLSILHV